MGVLVDSLESRLRGRNHVPVSFDGQHSGFIIELDLIHAILDDGPVHSNRMRKSHVFGHCTCDRRNTSEDRYYAKSNDVSYCFHYNLL